MHKLIPANKKTILFLLPFIIITTIFQSCKKKRSPMAEKLFKHTRNKAFNDVTPEGFSVVFDSLLTKERHKIRHFDVISSYYKANNNQPFFILHHLFNHDMALADSCFLNAGEHGLNDALFQAAEIKSRIDNFGNKKTLKSLNQAYLDMAKLELTFASALIDYSNDLQYGIINPKTVFQRYYISTKEPDSASMSGIFHIKNMRSYLDSIQPKDPQYKALQAAYIHGYHGKVKGFSKKEIHRILQVNMERLRWKNKPSATKYVVVNIPDYTLHVIDSGKTVIEMKVCVGQGRNMDNANTLASYGDSSNIDKPNERETPLLNSLIYGVEVNPVWNIPRSIANKEIIVQAAKDRFYLANNNIDVYEDGKKIDDPEDIDWSGITKQNLPYKFKQEPGTDNSLGLIKFMFDNKSDVYLHDTPAKWVFSQKMRAVSHGCVRLGNPRGLALTLFGPGKKYQTIADDMGDDAPDPTFIYMPKKVPLYITYNTCWADADGKLQFRKDVYGLDIVLYDHLQKLLHPKTVDIQRRTANNEKKLQAGGKRV